MKKIALGCIISLVAAALFLVMPQVSSQARDDSGGSDIAKQLEEIVKVQKEIQADLAVIKEELHIIKIRITQIQ